MRLFKHAPALPTGVATGGNVPSVQVVGDDTEHELRDLAPAGCARAGISRLGEVAVEQARQAKIRAYADGLRDGTLLVLDHIEGRASAPGRPYTGPLPEELRVYLTRTRARLEATGR